MKSVNFTNSKRRIKMGRLTKSEKELIIERALKDVFKTKEDKLELEGKKLADQMYLTLYTDSEKELLNKSPKKWFNHVTNCSCYINGCYTQMKFSGAKAITADKYGDTFSTQLLPKELSDKLVAWRDKRDQLNKDKKSLNSKLNSLVMPITTEKKLIEVWPDGAKYLTPCDKTENLPAITSKEVTELMAKLKGE